MPDTEFISKLRERVARFVTDRKPVVLIAEDSADDVAVMSAELMRLGYAVVNAVCGEKAVQAMIANWIDIVILDLVMPGRDGLDTLKEIKSSWPDTPVVIVTGHVDDAPMVKAVKELGYGLILQKPVTNEMFNKLFGLIRVT